MIISKLLTSIVVSIVAVLAILACQSGKSGIDEPMSFVPAATPVPARPSGPITIAAVGDMMLGSTSINESFLPPNDGADILKEVTPILSSADITFGNLEGPMLEGGKTTKCGPRATRCFAFRVPTRYGKYLKDAGFDVMSLANNHSGDFGTYGTLSTRRTLDELGIKHAGSDRDEFSTAIVESNGLRVAFVAFGHNNVVPNVNDIPAAVDLVRAAKRRADIVVVSFHGGAEGTDAQHVANRTEYYAGETRGNLPLFAHAVIDAGADLVLGHGPHVMRGMEVYKDRLICYSMGNFATYGMFRLEAETALSGIFEISIERDGKFISGKLHAAKQLGKGGPVLDPAGTSIRVVRNLSISDFGGNAPVISDDGDFVPPSVSTAPGKAN